MPQMPQVISVVSADQPKEFKEMVESVVAYSNGPPLVYNLPTLLPKGVCSQAMKSAVEGALAVKAYAYDLQYGTRSFQFIAARKCMGTCTNRNGTVMNGALLCRQCAKQDAYLNKVFEELYTEFLQIPFAERYNHVSLH